MEKGEKMKKFSYLIFFFSAVLVMAQVRSGCSSAEKNSSRGDSNSGVNSVNVSKKAGDKKVKVIGFTIGDQTVKVDEQDIVPPVKKGMEVVAAFTDKTSPTKSEIKKLAGEIGLLKEYETNPHLSFLDGDCAYWAEQGLSFKRLEIEFTARKIVLEAADKKGVIIPTQGDLSSAAQQIMGELLKYKLRLKKNDY